MTHESNSTTSRTPTLSERRHAAKLSVRAAAQKLDVSPRTLTRYEDGTTEPGAAVIVKMSELYDCGVRDICESAAVNRESDGEDDTTSGST